MMSQRQTSRTWLIIIVFVLLGLVVGLGLGLLFGWVIMPVKYVDTAIEDLAMDYKEEYILLVASAYAYDQDLEKAQARLAQLNPPNIEQWLTDLLDRYIAEEQDEQDIQVLADLAHGMGISSPQMLAYLATPTPTPTSTPLPTDTPAPTPTSLPTDTPTATPVPPTDTPVVPTEVPPTNTAVVPTEAPPTDTPVVPTEAPPTNTPVPPTNTPKPQPTNTPKPQPTNTPKPQPTNTPKPTNPPATKWTVIEQRLVGPGQDAQTCEGGNLQVRATVIDAAGNQISGVWLHDHYSGQNWPTGHKGADPFWGPGEAQFDYYGGGGGKLCITSGEGGPCESPDTRDMPCWNAPPFEDLWGAGYCECCEAGSSRERCQQLMNEGKCLGPGHYSWRVVFKRSW